MNAQTFGLIIAGLMAITALGVARGTSRLLTDNREARRYKALVDEDRAQEIQLHAEVTDLRVQFETSDMDTELAKLLGGFR